MIKAIIFDCFGVLASDGWIPFRVEHFGDKPGLLEVAMSLNKQVDVGLADYDDFIKKVAELAGVSAKATKKAIESNVPDEQLFAYIPTLKRRYKIGMLSNAGDNWLDEIFKPAHVALFDAVALSYETGVIKPNERAYEIIVDRLGVEPNECVFIDDQPRFVTGAQDVGMQAILYTNFAQCRSDLEKLL